jgi:PmbA protein
MTVTVGDGTSHWSELDRDISVLGAAEAIERTVAEAVAAQGRIPLPDGVYDVVFGPLATGGLLDTMSAYGFTGDAVASGVGAVARQQGLQVAAPSVEISDSPTAQRGLPFPFDLEGTPSRYVPFLRHGVVAGAVTDLESASKSGLPATGHAHIAREELPHEAPASITMQPGEFSTEELIAGVSRGVYIQRVWYLRVVDPAATTLTGGSRDACFLIEDGKLTQPVASARFTESVFGALSRVDAIGSEIRSQALMNVWNGSVTAPAMRVRGFRFGAAPIVTAIDSEEKK